MTEPVGRVTTDDGAGPARPRHPLAMVYGGGGVVGIAYTAGVAAGLTSAGIPVADAPALGTSAGSWTASALALGLTWADLDKLPVPSLPTVRTGVLAGIARQAFGEQTHPLVSISAVRLRSGRRRVFDGTSYPLADLAAASSAVPGLLPPHRIDGELYVDGGMWSATSVDAADDAQTVIVVAPLAGRMVGPMGRVAGALLERELDQWRRANPAAHIWMVRPNRAMASIVGVRPLALFDRERATAIYPLARAQGLRLGAQVQHAAAAGHGHQRLSTVWWHPAGRTSATVGTLVPTARALGPWGAARDTDTMGPVAITHRELPAPQGGVRPVRAGPQGPAGRPPE
ncbi:patatin-like phospholipase family protein [Nocardioides rubriscoriae]|uniref:patatin-like phospholipase family protein n=1 Tax=Nocardioides rubriscoriae TaxID=642762 RepID=UPI0011E0082B|nr:patatin-like phospholipase family protein [Nocardioides rubriscoriae]